MLLMHLFKHVNYIYQFSSMQQPFITGLKLKNSLTNQLELFEPRQGKNVKWYSCGPTVYAQSHMGHARNYICNDMIRRVLRDYFGYNIQLCMNITDVDDKIINRSKQQGVEYFKFAKKWENQFFEDMKAFGVEDPNYLTRVTEYIPEIVNYIDKIIKNGFAYEGKGSVYFDIKQYETKFKYGKLKRMKEAQTEDAEVNELGKKNKDDFALWKAAKPGEPFWNSPWGDGRPGWHIECSAMAGAILGQRMDIHSGGIDLIFPHHENQLAQSEAHNNQPDWVKYFIHVGHLHINKLKMSKKLKNFITIKQILENVSPRVVKLYFFLHRYDVVLNYDPQAGSLHEAQGKDKRFKNFFGNLHAAIRQSSISPPQKLLQEDIEFDQFLDSTGDKIFEAFCDNINTPVVIDNIDEAIKRTNIYLQLKNKKHTLLNKAYNIISRPLASMGLDYATQEKEESNETAIVNAVVKFRDEIRVNAKSDFKKILDICDKFRDYDMVDLSIRLEDKKVGEASTWKFEPKQILIKEREHKEQAKRKKQQEHRRKEEEKNQKMKRKPQELFKADARYSQFDEKGIPTHQNKKQKVKGAEGEKDKQVVVSKPINQKLRKKLQKQWNEQKGQYEKWLELEAGNKKEEEK